MYIFFGLKEVQIVLFASVIKGAVSALAIKKMATCSGVLMRIYYCKVIEERGLFVMNGTCAHSFINSDLWTQYPKITEVSGNGSL